MWRAGMRASDLMFATTNTPEGLSPDRPGNQSTPWTQARIETAVAIPARKDTGPPECMEHNIHDDDLRLTRPCGEQLARRSVAKVGPRSPECDASDLMFATTNTPEGLSPDRPGNQSTPWTQARIETAVAIPARKDTGPPEFLEHNIHDNGLRLTRQCGAPEYHASQTTFAVGDQCVVLIEM